MEEKYLFNRKRQYVWGSMVLAGLLIFLAGLLLGEFSSVRLWTNVLLNNLMFLFVALFGGVFLSLHRIALSGWHTAFQRVPEAMTTFLPISAMLMFLLYFGMHDLYHWSHSDIHDPILAGKATYLNVPFFFLRMAVYFIGWISLIYFMRKSSVLQDRLSDIKHYRRGKVFGALFMIFFAITISMSSWDWLMSIDAHWFSTLFGWYVFMGMFVIGLSALILFIALLRKQGYLKFITSEHVHDLGKYLFGFSIFWMYLWFSQYLLIWYSHLPEETVYYVPRLTDYKFIYFLMLILNFLIPFFGLMTRNSKRNLNWLSAVAIFVLVGHWLDLYLMITPGVMVEKGEIGLIEVAFTMTYLGLFMMVVLHSLSRFSLVSKNDPFIEESLNYES